MIHQHNVCSIWCFTLMIMWSSVFWDKTLYSPLESTNASEQLVSPSAGPKNKSIKNKQEASMQNSEGGGQYVHLKYRVTLNRKLMLYYTGQNSSTECLSLFCKYFLCIHNVIQYCACSMATSAKLLISYWRVCTQWKKGTTLHILKEIHTQCLVLLYKIINHNM
jgi:hypothetical protein